MSEHVERTLEMVVGQIGDLQRQLSEKKKIANGLCQLAGHPPMFEDEEPVNAGTSLRPDEFYGRPLATDVQELLERRRRSGLGAATVPEIYETLTRGGFHFNTKNTENAKRGLYNSLSKNPKFHRLPNNTYGLTEWYPNIKKGKQIPEENENDFQSKAREGQAQDEDPAVVASEVQPLVSNETDLETPDNRKKLKSR